MLFLFVIRLARSDRSGVPRKIRSRFVSNVFVNTRQQKVSEQSILTMQIVCCAEINVGYILERSFNSMTSVIECAVT